MLKQLLKSVIGLGVVALAAQTASAGLLLDLKINGAADPKKADLAGPGTVTLDVYATVTGADASVTNDGLSFGYIGIQSIQAGAKYITTGDITGVTFVNPFDKSGATATGVANTTTMSAGDGVGDWGGNPAVSSTTGWAKFAGITTPVSATANDNGTWKVASFTLNAAALNAAAKADVDATQFQIVACPSTGAIKGQQWVEDTVTKYNTTGTVSLGAPVTFTPVPEPASLGLLSVAALGLLARRRQA